MKPKRLSSITMAVLALGFGSQLAQVVLLRELLTVFFGHELSIGIILAGWMFWVGTGSAIAARLAPRLRHPMAAARVTATCILALLPLTVMFLRFLRGFFDVAPGTYLSLLDLAWSGGLAMGPVCLLLGMHFVLLARVWSERCPHYGVAGPANTYQVEAAGNALGGILFTLLLVHVLTAFHVAVIAGALMLLVLPRAGRGKLARLVAPAVAIAIFPWLGRVDMWASRVQWRLAAPGQHLVDLHQSRYGPVAILQRDDQYNIFQSGHLVFSVAGATATAALEEQAAVNLAHLSMTQHPHPRRVLLIGGGLRGVLREIARHPAQAIDYIEIDPVMLKAAEAVVSPSTRNALREPRVSVLHTDGRLHVKQDGPDYDIMIVDVPDPATAVLNRYYTREFFREARSRLAPGGVFIITLSGGDLRGTATANRNATVYHTLRSVFDRVVALGETDMLLVASPTAPGTISADPVELSARFRRRNIDADFFSEGNFSLLLEPSRLHRMNWILRHHGRRPGAHRAPPDTGPLAIPSLEKQEAAENALPPVVERVFINSDFRPIGYVHNLILWNRATRSRAPQLLERLTDMRPAWIGAVLAAALLAAFAIRLLAPRRVRNRWGKRYAVMSAIFTTGLSTMMLQVTLLFAFQAVYGYVYERVGMIIALFMAGLAAGTALMQRLMPRRATLEALAGIQALAAVFTVAISISLPLAGRLETPMLVFMLFAGMTFFAGMLCGADFPLAVSCFRELSQRPECTAGWVYGIELMGACLGAVAASVVLAPVFGLTACALTAAAMNATACILFLPFLDRGMSIPHALRTR